MKSTTSLWSQFIYNASLLFTVIFVLSVECIADVSTPAVIGDNMVLQQNHKNPIWGWDNPAETIIVKIAGQSHKAKADSNGYWKVTLDPMKASSSPKKMTIQVSSSLTYENIL